MYLCGLSTKTLQNFLTRYRRDLAHKEQVMARHKPGSPWHTRATREAEVYRARIARVEQELERRIRQE